MGEGQKYPPESYCQLFLGLFEQLNGSDSIESVVERQGRNYNARLWCSRGDVLEKAGMVLMQIRHHDADGLRLIRHFDTVIHPHNPLVPGFVLVVGQEVKPSRGENRIYCLVDMWRTTRQLDQRLSKQFRAAIESVCQDHERSYDELHRSLPGIRLFGGNGCNVGLLFSQFGDRDSPFLDQLVRRLADEIVRVVQLRGERHPNVQDFQERNEIRREFIVWALTQNEGNKGAVAAGVPWEIFEAFAFPPEVHY